MITIKEKDIVEIEKTVNEDKYFVDGLQSYKSSEQFFLKPGHKSLIINLATTIENHLKLKKSFKPSKCVKSDELIKTEIVKNLSKYMSGLKCPTVFSLNDVTEFQKDDQFYRCKIKCKFCLKTCTANYKSYWMLSNVKAHLKKHVTDASKLSITTTNPEQITQRSQIKAESKSSRGQSQAEVESESSQSTVADG